ncbi:pitrilysin [Aliidiomarina indica]|uniref:pitrilysin n=1 Tax=Aliidiomarina indica TaxID=2749147 RepID=UPI00188E3CA7|nr:pitrilysin [Aliidiomarina indica]
MLSMQHNRMITLSAFVAIFMLGCSPATPPEDVVVKETGVQTSPNDTREYRAITLENQLQVVLVSDPEAEKSAAALAVRVGSLQDPVEQQGMSHYLEHMLFLGTEKYPEPGSYDEFMSQNGGMNNAYAAQDHTNYMFEVNNSALPEALDRFADFFRAPLLYPEYAEKEVNAVHSEWSMRSAADGFILFALLGETINPEHPAAQFNIGNLETLRDKPDSKLHDELVAFYERYYSANQMTAAVLGNRSLDELEMLARDAFADIPNHDVDAPVVNVPAVTERDEGILLRYKPQMEMRSFFIDFVIDNNRDDYAYKPNELVAYLLNSEMPGTPAALFRELGWLDSLGAYAQPDVFGNQGLFRIGADLTEAGYQNREVMVGVLLNYLEQIQEQGIERKYYEELETVLENDFTFLRRRGGFQYTMGLAANLLHYPAEHVISHSYILRDYDPERINNVLAQLLPERARVTFISPNEEVDTPIPFTEGFYARESLTEDTLTTWKEQGSVHTVQLPDVNRLLPEDLSVVAGAVHERPQHVVDSGTASAWLMRSERFAEPRAEVRIQLYQPFHARSLEEQMARAVLMDMFSLSQQALGREASIAGVSFNLSASDGLNLSLSGFNDKQPLLAERVLTDFAEFEPSAPALAQSVDRIRRSIQNARLRFPVQQLMPNFNQLMRLPSADVDAQLAALQQITPADIRAVRDQLLQNNMLRMYVHGNYSDEAVQALAARMAELGGANRAQSLTRAPIVIPSADLRISWQADVSLDDTGLLDVWMLEDDSMKNRAHVALLNEMMSSRFFTELRTEDQLGYSVGITTITLDDYAGLGFLIQSPVRGPAPLLERFDTFRAQYAERLASMTEEEFKQFQQGVLTNLTQPPQTLAEEAGRLITDWQNQRYRFDSRTRYQHELESATLASVSAYFDRLFSASNSARVLVQLRGRNFTDIDFATLEELRVIDSVSAWSDERLQSQ